MAQARFRFQGELVSFLAPERRAGAFSHGCARAATVKIALRPRRSYKEGPCNSSHGI